MPIVVTAIAPDTTVLTIIKRSMRMIGKLPSGETPSDDEISDCLEALNAMIGVWDADNLYVYANQEESLSLTASTKTYSIGPSGDLDTTRPREILKAWIVDASGNRFDVEVCNEDTWRRSVWNDTFTSNYPVRILYRPTMPTGTLLVNPTANSTAYTLSLLTVVQIVGFSDSTVTLSLPPGYYDAIASNLAIAIAPEFKAQVSQEVLAIAKISKAAIKNANIFSMESATSLQSMFGEHGGNIILGEGQ